MRAGRRGLQPGGSRTRLDGAGRALPDEPGLTPSSPAAQRDVPGRRKLSLAHLSLIGLSPEALIRTAGCAGFDLVDLRLAPATPTDRIYGDDELKALCRALPPILRDTGLCVGDVEIIRLNDRTRPQDHLRLMETAAALGARRIKLVCDSEDHGRSAETLGRLCDLAAPFGLVMDLEYMIFSGVTSLRAAMAVVETAGRANLRVLVDALHWVRAGDIALLKTADPARLGYVQLCDGPLRGPADRQALIQEARTSRLAPGDGEFPLDDLLAAMPPNCVASLEVPLPSGQGPLAHARRLLEAARTLSGRHERETAS
ncbi:MAG TPA: sugar phosphate isomerase/epimerase [Rhizomicrobium sp.]|nr:sugar phosphate isomerase/epimerase [Rhizomicrobium sp.]